jgi:hypothetical protein
MNDTTSQGGALSRWTRHLTGRPALTEFGDDPRDWDGSLHDVHRSLPRGARAEAAVRALDEHRSRRAKRGGS